MLLFYLSSTQARMSLTRDHSRGVKIYASPKFYSVPFENVFGYI